MKTPADKDWTPVTTFATVTEAARRIVELDGIPKNGLFLEFYVETDEFGTDNEAVRVFHYTGKRALRDQKRPAKLKRRFLRGMPALWTVVPERAMDRNRWRRNSL